MANSSFAFWNFLKLFFFFLNIFSPWFIESIAMKPQILRANFTIQ